MRRVLASPDFRDGFVEMLPACLGLVPFGLVCGVGAAAAVLAFDALPMRRNLIVAGVLGIAAGTVAELARERWTTR